MYQVKAVGGRDRGLVVRRDYWHGGRGSTNRNHSRYRARDKACPRNVAHSGIVTWGKLDQLSCNVVCRGCGKGRVANGARDDRSVFTWVVSRRVVTYGRRANCNYLTRGNKGSWITRVFRVTPDRPRALLTGFRPTGVGRVSSTAWVSCGRSNPRGVPRANDRHHARRSPFRGGGRRVVR